MAVKRKTAKRQNVTTQRAGESLWRDGFISVLSKYGNVTKAAEAVGISRAHAYRVRDESKAFSQQWDDALLEAADNIEFEALRRAKRGTLKPIYYKGQRVGYEREYSDTLMGMMLKGHKPDKYGDKLTLKISATDMELLQRFNMTPGQAFEKLIQMLDAEAKAGGNE